MSRPRRGKTRPRPAPLRAPEVVTVTKVAQQGDGEALLADGVRVFMPLTLPGDIVRVQPGAKRGDGMVGSVLEFIETVPRAAPICPVFGQCGGCQLQHMPADAYAEWKRDAVAAGLSRQGIDIELEPLRTVPLASRRRASLAAVMTQNGLRFGFNEAHSDRIIDIPSCPLLVSALQNLLAPVRAMLVDILAGGERADIAMTAVGVSGQDVELAITSRHKVDLKAREALAAFAEAHDVVRIAWSEPGVPPEQIVQRRDLMLHLGGVDIQLPINGFLQPSVDGEALLQDLVIEGLGDIVTAKGGRIADLYCGVGTFALPLAAVRKHVLAVDGIATQAGALATAAGRAGLGGRLSTDVRDLKMEPLMPNELNEFDAVIFDPPRAGAKVQVEELANSIVPCIIAVSCNPATLGRDLRILIDAGYRLDKVTPVDQFPMTHHAEAVAVLRRPS
jgi:23S rRNA (uracil1939-C5)-methyltransferase